MKRTLTSAISLTLALSCSISAQAAGYKSVSISADHRGRDIDLHLWYPTDKTSDEITLGQNAVFTGHDVYPGATPRDGAYPLIVLSHGSGGNAVNLGWIASFLADQGMIVAATNHPGTTSGDSRQSETVKIWERPADISAILDHFESKGVKGLTPDMTRIGAVGFSLGGYSVLGAGGARVNKQAFIDYCDTHAELWDCAWYARGGVDLNDTDQTLFEQSNRDPRLKAIYSVDPALALAYTSISLSQMDIPVEILNLGAAETIPLALDGKQFAQHLAKGSLSYIEGAHHFSFLGLCTPIGQQILDGSDEGPLCIEVSDRDRSDIHNEIKTKMAAFFAAHL